MKSGGASRTAVFVCQGRAVADGRLAVGRFSDPAAERLLTDAELGDVRAARSTEVPADARTRFRVEAVRACAEVMAPRTVYIDEAMSQAVAADRTTQVVLLGAGLDGRPWRLRALQGTTVFAVDHPASLKDAEERSRCLDPVAGRLVRVPVDLTAQPLGPTLEAAGHDRSQATLWVWEGVVPYLRAVDVGRTAAAVAVLSASGSVLIVNYQAPSLAARLGRRAMALLTRVSRVETVTADEPWLSTWTSQRMTDLLTGNGFALRDDVGLLGVARELGTPTVHARSLSIGRVAVGVRRSAG